MRPQKFILHGDTQRDAAIEALAAPMAGRKTCEVCGAGFVRGDQNKKYFSTRRFCSHKCRGIGSTKTDVLSRYWGGFAERDFGKCWNWQMAKSSGYGVLRVSGKTERMHRFAGYIAHGDGGDLYACHSCNNRACVNPFHIYWGSHQDNMKDAQVCGANANKLTPDQAIAIRQSSGTNVSIAEAYGVSPTMVGLIKSGKSWMHV